MRPLFYVLKKYSSYFAMPHCNTLIKISHHMFLIYAVASLCAENYPNYVAMSHCLLSLKSGRPQSILLRPLFYVLEERSQIREPASSMKDV